MKILFTSILLLTAVFFNHQQVFGQKPGEIKITRYHPLSNDTTIEKAETFKPLDKILVLGTAGKTIVVTDGNGDSYGQSKLSPGAVFTVGGSLGKHSVYLLENGKRKLASSFIVDAKTNINDGGYYNEMFNLFYNSMWDKPGQIGSVSWNGRLYHYFVPWGLDHNHTMKGLKYFSGYGAEFIDLCREAQREDGMIWSFVQYQANADYWLTRDKYTGYTKKIGDKIFVRQPTENHPEYIFVNSIYQCWKATGDEEWMKKNLNAGAKALDYTLNDPARWSKRFNLLKRVYTIDSWDFQVDDEYLPDLGITNSMILDPVKSKFGVFFGDNTGYISACNELAEMYEKVGNASQSMKYKTRAKEIKDRLDKLAWNGHFYTHFIEEDTTVKRHLGVDEKLQLAQSNAYSINRDIDSHKKKEIIETYLDLQKKLPIGSPGEWYAIYPPFQKGFGAHNSIWQYMNGGVGGHVAGELAKGAFENGYEKYGADILNRLFELGKKYDHKIYFAYTGSLPLPPPHPTYKTLNLSAYANMDFWDRGSKDAKPWMLVTRKGDDLHQLPVGKQNFKNISFDVIDPEKNNRKAVVAVSHLKDFPSSVEIPVNDTGACIYLLHTSTKPTSENVAGNVTLVYNDGSKKHNYMIMGKHLTYWWFSQLKTDYSGIAWYGKNDVSEGVGLSWSAIDNPFPGKKISKIILEAPADDGIYTVFSISLAAKPHYVAVNPVSFGGPDNWAGATAMAALVEGLAGIKDSPKTEAFSSPVIAPRWINTNANDVTVTIRYEASQGYVSYHYKTRPAKRQIELLTTGSGKNMMYHIELPENVKTAKSVIKENNEAIPFKVTTIENTNYIDFTQRSNKPTRIMITY